MKTRSIIHLASAVLSVFACVLAPQESSAATYYYDNDSSTPGFGTAGGTWVAPTPGPIPGWTTDAAGSSIPGSISTTTSDPINFGNGATGLGAGTVTLSGTLSSSNITFASGSGAIVLSGGTSLTLPATAVITVNNSSDTIATPLAGAATGLIKAGSGRLILSGANAVSGTLTLNSGELQLNGGSFNLGAKAVTLTTATSTSQQAVLNLANGSLTNSVSDSIGFGTNAVGVIKLSSGNYVKTGTGSACGFNLGSGSGKTNYGAFLMSGGNAMLGGEFNWARDGTGASALVSLSGGTLSCSNYATVGREGFGVFDISGGAFVRGSGAINKFYMGRTAGQFAQVTIRGTGTANFDDNAGFFFANSATPVLSGVVNLMAGGTFISRVGITWNANPGSMGHFNFNGGTLQASGSSATYWNGLWTACYIYSGGAIIDSQGNNITIPQPLVAPTGNGVTSITGGTGSGYLAPPVVSISGDGTGATAISQVDSSGNVTNILITNPGVNYTTAAVALIGGGGTASGWTAAIGANAATGGLTKLGSGTLTLSGASTYQGATRIGAGVLAIAAGNYPASSALTLSNNATLNLDVTGGASTLASPSLTLGTNTTLNLSYGALAGNPFQPAISDATINAGTVLTANGTNIVINLSGLGFTAGQVPIIKYSGSIGGKGFAAFKLGTLPSGVPATSQLVNNTANKSIDLSIPLVNTLTWNGTNSDWDINTTFNWKDSLSSPSVYKQYGTTNIYGDVVTFDDTLSNPSQTSINLTTTLRPTVVNLSAGNAAYAFGGSGKLSGGSFLNVSGSATVTISTANDYTGGSTLSAGTVLVGNDAALGAGTVTLAGAILASDSAAPRTLANAVTILADTTLGTGPSSGALTLAGPVDLGGLAHGLTLENNVALTGPLSNGGISKSGAGTLTLDNAGTVLSETIWINAGKVTLNNGTFTGPFNVAPIINQAAVIEIGNANITNTAQNNIATAPNNVGVVKQNGGSFVESGVMAFGASSSSAAYLMSGGYAYFGGDTRLDYLGAVGLISQSGGTMVSANYFSLARDSGLGVYDLSGGTHYRPATAVNRFYMTRTDGSTAQLNIRGTGTMDIEDSLGLSFANNYTNTAYGCVNILAGGTLISRAGLYFGNTGAASVGYVNFNSGTLRASGSAANYWSGWTGGYIYGGGATIDSQDNTIGIGQTLLAPTGSGVASITGFSGSGYFSPPVVSITGDGTGATAVAQIDASGNITGILVTCPGVNYTYASVTLNGGGGSGSGGTAHLGANATTGGLTKLGSGTLTLSGTNTYGGLTAVSNGTLVLGKAHAAPGNITVADGATLGCWSDTPAASVRLPSATLGVGTGAGLLARFTGNTGNPATPAGYITNLTLNGSTPVSVLCSGIQAGTIPLIQYSTLSGAGSITTGTLPQGVVGAISNNTATKTIELVITSLAPLVWSGANGTSWDINVTTNWLIGAAPKTFLDGSGVLFDDTAVNPSVMITQAVSPGSIVFSNNALAYTVTTSGAGALGGATGLVKAGTNSLILSGANTYLGSTLISAGTLEVGIGGTAGSLATGGSVQIDAGATLVHNRSDVAGFGSQNISGSGTLNKIGSSDGPGLTGTNTFSGQINIQTATLGLVGSESENGQPSVYVAPGARLAIGSGFNSGYATIGNLTGGGDVNASYTSGAGTRGLQVNQTTDGTFAGVIADGTSSRLVALTKTGPAALTLSGTSTYTGPTAVSNGTLIVNGAISGSAVAVEAGAALGGSGTLAVSVSFAAGSVATNNVGAPLTVGILDMAGNGAMHVATASPIGAGEYPLISYTTLTGSGQFTTLHIGGAGLAAGTTASVVFTNSAVALSVVGGTPAPTNITYTAIGGQLVLDWPAGQGWMLQSNSVSLVSPNSWFNVTGATPPFTNTVNPANPPVFYRLKY